MDILKRNIIIIICLTINSVVYSQKADYDIISLKGGKTIKGIIIEQIPFQTMKIVTPKKDTIVLSVNEVDSISRESFTGNQNLLTGKSKQFILEGGFTQSLTDNYSGFLKLNLIIDWRVKPELFAGIGIGVRYNMIDNQQKNPSQIDFSPLFNNFGVPVFADIRAVFTEGKLTGYAALQLGYSFDLSDDPVRGVYYFKQGIFSFTHIAGAGIMVCPAFGIALKTSDRSAINLGFAFETHFYRKYWEYTFVEKSPSVSAGLIVGYSF
jgi:hypothetical protein